MLAKIRDLFRPKMASATGAPAAPAAASDTADALFAQAQTLQQQGALDGSIALYDRLIELDPTRAAPYYKRGNARNSLGRLEDALADYDRAIALDAGFAYAWCNRGSVLERLQRREEALSSLDRALALEPKDALTHFNRASVLKDLGRLEEALAAYDAALGIDPGYTESHVNRGNILQEMRRHEAAIESFDRAIALKPGIVEAFQGRGVSEHVLRRFTASLADFDKAIELNPQLAGLRRKRGDLLTDLQRHDAALADYSKAAELDASDVENFHSLGAALVRHRRYELAIASFDRALELDPDAKYLPGTRRNAQMQVCDWNGLDADLEAIAAAVRADKPVCNPMTLAALTDAPALQRAAARVWLRDQIKEGLDKEGGTDFISAGSKVRRSAGSGRIRIGYFSSDLRAHPVGYVTAGLFEHHDRARFEVTAFVFGPETNDALAGRISQAFERLVDVRRKSDREVAELARELGIDIAIDLNGITEHCRTKIFALRAAPIQINFLGYPGTMGGEFMDYLIADGTVVPRSHQRYYDEKILYLPGSFMPFDSRYEIADKAFTREELGLPRDGTVFCSFNNSYKITPEVFERWMSVLRRTAGSVLWLQQQNSSMPVNLRREAARLDVDPERLVFAPRMSGLPEHLARLRSVDLFLDTFPYNAHATTLDALWAGVPLLTRPGEGFPSRVAASLLRTAGLPELIVDSAADYEELAVSLAADPARLAQLRSALAERGAALFDTARYTKNLEEGYRAIYERHRAGEPPVHINEQLAQP